MRLWGLSSSILEAFCKRPSRPRVVRLPNFYLVSWRERALSQLRARLFSPLLARSLGFDGLRRSMCLLQLLLLPTDAVAATSAAFLDHHRCRLHHTRVHTSLPSELSWEGAPNWNTLQGYQIRVWHFVVGPINKKAIDKCSDLRLIGLKPHCFLGTRLTHTQKALALH